MNITRKQALILYIFLIITLIASVYAVMQITMLKTSAVITLESIDVYSLAIDNDRHQYVVTFKKEYFNKEELQRDIYHLTIGDVLIIPEELYYE